MSNDRDQFVDLSYSLLNNDELLQPDKQFWIEYILRFLKGKDLINTYSLGDVLEWNFTGDNIIFTEEQLQIPLDQLLGYFIYDWGGATTIRRFKWDGNDVYVIGLVGSDIVAQKIDTTSGTVTTLTGLTFGVGLCDIAIDSNGLVYAVGDNTLGGSDSYFAVWNGIEWTDIPTPGVLVIKSYVVDAIGTDIYIGGQFIDSSWPTESRVRELFKYDGSFTVLISDAVASGGTIWDMELDTDGNLYLTGQFDVLDGVTVYNVAKYTVSTGVTSAIGSGIQDDGVPYAIHKDSSGYVWVGLDLSLGGTSVIYRWDGSLWENLNIDAATTVYGITTIGEVAYCVGDFDNIYVWDGSWKIISTGTEKAYLAISSDSYGNIYF